MSPDSPYFITETGDNWTPIGQNDAITWPDLEGLFERRNLPAVGRYLDTLVDSGVTCLRLMMEYAERRHSLFETGVGVWNPVLVDLWDDLFEMCARRGLRVLFTPYDTFWMKIKWADHPYNSANGGFCDQPARLLLHPETRAAAKARLAFASERWGGTGVLFAWDVWNEIHPSFAEDSGSVFDDFIADLSGFLRDHECRVHGRAHPQTVSMFSPHIHLDACIPDAIYRHARLDFVSTHLYEEGAIDFPQNTVDSAIRFGALVKEAILQGPSNRPYFDSEHGPIHLFLDHHRQLPEEFDDEYFRHMQWAHLATGGVGGGMRWPYRMPHCLTPGMRKAQRVMADFLPLIDWRNFNRRVLDLEVEGFAAFGCASDNQAVLYLLRRGTLNQEGMVDRAALPVAATVKLPDMKAGCYRVIPWDTVTAERKPALAICHAGGPMQVNLPAIATDGVFAVRTAL